MEPVFSIHALMISTQTFKHFFLVAAGKGHYPFKFRASTSVQYGDTFLVVGGHDETAADRDAVYAFDPQTENWTLMPERMSGPKHGVAAVLVGPGDFLRCS